ncbi:MAG TPA: hypothetical protein VK483_06570 [Chitinophagaceae bacterium]|nr:hypothetical protein [Chitinophagaceae bacterium]
MSSLQNKILNHEVTPPNGVWEKIANALDESELAHEFPSKLYEAEVLPPVSVWNKIANSLDAEYEAAIPERRRISPLFKYAAAAVVIGLLAWGGMQVLNNRSGNKELVKQEVQHSEKDSPESFTNENNASADNSISEEARNDAALEASKRTFAKLDIPVKSRIKEIASGFSFAASSGTENIPGIFPNDEMISSNPANRYITLMTPEGNIIRMSKKLTDMVCCVSGEDENDECKDQMKKWREKIICSPTCHSTGSFMDMLDLVHALQDN